MDEEKELIKLQNTSLVSNYSETLLWDVGYDKIEKD